MSVNQSSSQNQNYVGRFAPSPTGPLHLGSLIAALASYLDARHHQGQWLLRIEDLDPPRESKEAPGLILEQLNRLGFVWDGDPLFQSQRLDRFEECLALLREAGLLFHCTCSRKSFAEVYPGRCRGSQQTELTYAVRIQVSDERLTCEDSIQSPHSYNLREDIGDFILKRKDGLFAYQLAVVVDDYDQGVTHVIRGSDLLDSTPRQIYLARCLGFSSPQFGHIPVIVDAAGQKLSKQSHARPIDLKRPAETLKTALRLLGQKVPEADQAEEILVQAAQDWRLTDVPKQLSLQDPLL